MKKNLFLGIFFSFALMMSAQAQESSASWAEGLTVVQDLFEPSMKEGVSCYRIPALVTAPNGDLIAAIDERVLSCGDLKWNKDINIAIRRSADRGKTWSPIETIVDFPLGQSASDPSMIVDKSTGEIFLFYNYMDLDKEKDVYYFHVISSRDNGKTWSAPRDITPEISEASWKHDFKFITSGRGTYTSDGQLLHTIVNLEKGLFVFASDDHGQSWRLINHPLKPGDESKIVELPDGTWMVNSRVNEAGIRYIHTSADKGQTWTTRPDSALVDPGCNASISRYGDLLLFSNVANEKERRDLTVKLSNDQGKTWPIEKRIYTGSAAYSSMSVLDDGSVALFFERNDYQTNSIVVFTLEWLRK